MFPSQEINEESAARIRSNERRIDRLETLEQAGGGDWSCLDTQIIGAGDSISAITFSAIPQTFYHLALWVSAGSGLFTGAMKLTFNGDTGANYRWKWNRWFLTGITHSHSEQGSLGDTSITVATPAMNDGADIGNRNAMEANIPGYTSLVGHKSVAWRSFFFAVDHGGEAPPSQVAKELGGGDWKNMAAITSITLTGSQNYHEGSIFTLMGVCPK